MGFSLGTIPILTVSELTDRISESLERDFGLLFVEGEVSNLSMPVSGHRYFTLKDDRSQIRAVLFRGAGEMIPFEIMNGQRLVCFGRLGVYKLRGEYQIIVEQAEPAGLGSLHLAFEQLKMRLQVEGLFDERHKKPLPEVPRRIGVVTSATGAAIRDILKVLMHRGAGLEVVVAPVKVQGEGAAEEIARAIEVLNAEGALDVIIAGRGGGSIEDLWPFNEERVARAIFASRVPVISAVGHERDFTIADFAADLRAPTPTAAAEIVVRRIVEVGSGIEGLQRRMAAAISASLVTIRLRLERDIKRLKDPGRKVEERRLRIDEILLRAERAVLARLKFFRASFEGEAGRLHTLSPLAVLSRGYAIATTVPIGKVIMESGDVSVGDEIDVRLKASSLRCRVESKTY